MSNHTREPRRICRTGSKHGNIRELEDRVDVEPLALELLRHGEANDFAAINFGYGESGFVRAEVWS